VKILDREKGGNFKFLSAKRRDLYTVLKGGNFDEKKGGKFQFKSAKRRQLFKRAKRWKHRDRSIHI